MNELVGERFFKRIFTNRSFWCKATPAGEAPAISDDVAKKPAKAKCLAFVMGGGGARGALQVGALRALFEAGYNPDLLVGTSIGSANAAGLAVWGANMDGIARLEQAYQTMAGAQFMVAPGKLAWNVLLKRTDNASQRARDFLIAAGISAELRFDQIENVRLGVVGANLDSGQPMIYGLDPGHSVLGGVLASCALPPWFAPVEHADGLIVDGGALSNLPIEPALAMGATEIIALDLRVLPTLSTNSSRLSQLEMFISAVTQREMDLEIALAEARGVKVRHLKLQAITPTPIWNFSSYKDLIEIGYEIARREILNWN